jgi:chromosome segregation ATPase
MPFIRAKTRKNSKHLRRRGKLPRFKTYYYLVENYREKGRVRQRTLAYLGKYASVEESLTGLPADIEKHQRFLSRAYQSQQEVMAYLSRLSRFEDSHRYWQERCQEARETLRQAEQQIDRLRKELVALEGRLVKLQILSRSPERLVLTLSGRGEEGGKRRGRVTRW